MAKIDSRREKKQDYKNRYSQFQNHKENLHYLDNKKLEWIFKRPNKR